MAYYDVCPDCGANLDPGESCDCKTKRQEYQTLLESKVKANAKTGQYAFLWETQETEHVAETFA